MTSAYSKSSPFKLIQKSIVFKLFHSGKRFQKVPFSWIFLCGYKRISVDGRPNRNNKVAFSNLSGIVWTGPYCLLTTFITAITITTVDAVLCFIIWLTDFACCDWSIPGL